MEGVYTFRALLLVFVVVPVAAASSVNDCGLVDDSTIGCDCMEAVTLASGAYKEHLTLVIINTNAVTMPFKCTMKDYLVKFGVRVNGILARP